MNDNKRFTSTALLTGAALLIGLMMTQSASAQQILNTANGFGTTSGTNPGNLTMYYYSGTHANGNASASSPIVVAMHGCQQTADEYVRNSGLLDLADLHAFHLVVPEQKTGFFGNHAAGCFNWFQSGDATYNNGEAKSIYQMVEHFRSTGKTGPVYASGFSAGGGMATVMLAAYPDDFEGAVIHAGLPYRCALTVAMSYPCMGTPGFLAVTKSAGAWGALLGDSGSTSSTWGSQKLAIFHSNDDTTVTPSRMGEIWKQWNGVGATVSQTSFNNIGHKVAVSTSGCGPNTGAYVSTTGNICAQSVGLHDIGVWL